MTVSQIPQIRKIKTEPRIPDYTKCFLLPIEISHTKKTDDVSKYENFQNR
jgi:hypothetical protein